MNIPVLKTERLVLRRPQLSDAPAIQTLASAREVAEPTGRIRHPYPPDGALQWLDHIETAIANDKEALWGITLRATGEYMGTTGFVFEWDNRCASVGYWLGVPYWGNGYATEAAHRIIQWGFEALDLNRIYATAFTTNTASLHVLEKLGMSYEGTQRQHVFKWGEYKDLAYYSLLREEYV